MLYFLGLTCALPFAVTIIAILAFMGLLFYWLWKDDRERLTEKYDNNNRLTVAIVLFGTWQLVSHGSAVATRYGGWDAWAQWNYHANILAHPAYWKNMFLDVRFDHPDYPLFLPATIGFFSRLCGGSNVLIPQIVSAFFTFAIPLIIYIDVREKRKLLAAVMLLVFAYDSFYLARGLSQYADTPLAFFFLCALVCFSHVQESRKMVVLCAAFLGCCCWTKNEGIVITAVFLLFNANVLLRKRHILPFVLGIAAPLAVLFFFKLAYAPANDMVSGQGGNTLQLALQPARYKMIYTSLLQNIQANFNTMAYATMGYIAVCLWRKVALGRQFVMMLTCIVAYNQIYAISVLDLAYHLSTSQDRLIHQLMPAFMYVVASTLPSRPEIEAAQPIMFRQI